MADRRLAQPGQIAARQPATPPRPRPTGTAGCCGAAANRGQLRGPRVSAPSTRLGISKKLISQILIAACTTAWVGRRPLVSIKTAPRCIILNKPSRLTHWAVRKSGSATPASSTSCKRCSCCQEARGGGSSTKPICVLASKRTRVAVKSHMKSRHPHRELSKIHSRACIAQSGNAIPPIVFLSLPE